jgi:hypothetical protein
LIHIQVTIRLVAALLVIGAFATPAPAQTPRGAFERLAPGDQRIARSLFEAQRRDLPPGGRFTLDHIAAKKGGERWSLVFREMKAQGLVTAKNLEQVVSPRASRHERSER